MEYRHRLFGPVTNVPGRPTAMTPQLEVYDYLRYVISPSSSEESPEPKQRFQIVLNVRFFNPDEIHLRVFGNSFIELRAKHLRRQANGTWFTRDCVFTYKLPKDVKKDDLVAEWTANDFLIIEATSSAPPLVGERKDRLIPKRTNMILKPAIDVCYFKDRIENAEEKLKQALHYAKSHAFVTARQDPMPKDNDECAIEEVLERLKEVHQMIIKQDDPKLASSEETEITTSESETTSSESD